MNPSHTHFIVTREIELHKRALDSWATQVLRRRDCMDALRAARHPPAAGPLIRSMSSLYRHNSSQARRKIQAHLMSLVEAMEDQAFQATQGQLLQATAGTWPEIYRAIDTRARQLQ